MISLTLHPNMPFHQRLFKYGLWATYLLFALTFIGHWSYGGWWLETLELLLNVYIALFLIYNFNPFTRKKMDEFGREIAFSAGVLLLLTKGVTHIFDKVLNEEQREGTRKISEVAYEIAEIV